MNQIQISASILAADFGNLNKDIQTIENHIEWIHVDVMDGHFVPNISIGMPIVQSIKSPVPMECHLMISNPEKYILDFIKAGAVSVSTHIELGEDNAKQCIHLTRSKNCLAGIVINPPTPIESILPVLDQVDYVLVMSVNPGFGGQSFIPETLEKIRFLREKKPSLSIHIDGGINKDTAPQAIHAGANNLIAGSYIFNNENRIQAIQNLKNN